jgi:hypothetical protein
MTYDAPDFSGDAAASARNRDVLNRSLVEDMSKQVMSGRTSIDIDVGGAKSRQGLGREEFVQRDSLQGRAADAQQYWWRTGRRQERQQRAAEE